MLVDTVHMEFEVISRNIDTSIGVTQPATGARPVAHQQCCGISAMLPGL
jgi:hypothetical protein